MEYFPLPTLQGDSVRDGSVVPAPVDCRRCKDRECERDSTRRSVQLCRFGFNYLRLSADVLAIGFHVANTPASHKRHRAALRKYGQVALRAEYLENLVRYEDQLDRQEVESLEREVDELRVAVLTDTVLHEMLVERLKSDIERSAGQLHDYIDLAAQIVKQLNVYLGTNYPEITVPDDLDDAPDELQSIYWLARIMEEKVAGFGYYLNPESVRMQEARFRLHGLVTKYRKMYQRDITLKRLTMDLGTDYSYVDGNADALAVIVHSLVDNAIKYAPVRSTIDVRFHKSVDSKFVVMEVCSLGPRIDPDERDAIFLPFSRGSAASATDVEGMGFGLAFAQRIAAEYNQRIEVEQEESPLREDGFYLTTFRYAFKIG